MTAVPFKAPDIAADAGPLLRRATIASVAVSFVLIAIKVAAYVATGSVALLSSLVDSILDSVASLLNYFAVRQAIVPADHEHRFGHGKAEPLAGMAQAAFIAGSALFLVFESLNRLVNQVAVRHGGIGIAVIALSLILTIILVVYQRRVVKRTGSLAIRADSLHYTSDVLLNVSVIAALALSSYGGFPAADPLFAIAIAAWIIYSAWRIAKLSLDQLMDRELPDEDRERIKNICREHPQVRDVHDLRTRASGMHIFIQLHLELDARLSLLEAHGIADDVEKRLREAFPNADVLIHQDPGGVES